MEMRSSKVIACFCCAWAGIMTSRRAVTKIAILLESVMGHLTSPHDGMAGAVFVEQINKLSDIRYRVGEGRAAACGQPIQECDGGGCGDHHEIVRVNTGEQHGHQPYPHDSEYLASRKAVGRHMGLLAAQYQERSANQPIDKQSGDGRAQDVPSENTGDGEHPQQAGKEEDGHVRSPEAMVNRGEDTRKVAVLCQSERESRSMHHLRGQIAE